MVAKVSDSLRTRTDSANIYSVVSSVIEAALMTAVFIFFVFPIVWIVLTSFKTRADALSAVPVWIFTPTLDAYQALLFNKGWLENVVNSLFVSIINTVLVLIISLPAGYSMGRYDTGGEHALMYVLSLRFLPPIVVIPALFVQFDFLNLIGTRWSLVLLYCIFNIPFAVWLFRAAIKEIPEDFFDAAEMDGASEFEMLLYIAIPMIRPVIFSVALISFIFAWNEFLFALVFTSGSAATAPVPLGALITGREVFWNQVMAGATVLLLPVTLLTYFSNQYIVKGLTFGTVE